MCLPAGLSIGPQQSDETAVVLVKSPSIDFAPAIFPFRHALQPGHPCEYLAQGLPPLRLPVDISAA